MTQVDHTRMANAIRGLAMDAVEKAKSGHPGLPMGAADVATVLWTQFLKFDAAEPNWPDRDRFVLSAGHGSMLLYALLYLTGNSDVTLDQIKDFRQRVGGVGRIIMMTRQGLVTHAEAEKSFRLAARDVLPQLQDLEPVEDAATMAVGAAE